MAQKIPLFFPAVLSVELRDKYLPWAVQITKKFGVTTNKDKYDDTNLRFSSAYFA